MSKILCVLFDDPIDGYPPAYARDDIPVIDHYPGGQTAPSPKAIDFKPGPYSGAFLADWVYVNISKLLAISSW